MPIFWDLDKTQEKIEEIGSAEKITYLEESDRYVLFKYPSSYEFKLATVEEQKLIRQGLKDGFLSVEEMTKALLDRGIWKIEYEEKVIELRSKISGLKVVKDDPSLTKTETRRKVLSDSIDKLEKELLDLEWIKESKLEQTAERKAKRARLDYLCWCSAHDLETRKKIFKSFGEYMISGNPELRADLLTNFINFIGGHTTEEIRFLARSNAWRVNFIVATQANTTLFNRAAIDFTPDQKNLVYWSYFYKNIYEMLPDDRPDDETIDNDEELDKWLEDYHQRRAEERQSARLTKVGSSSAMNKDEVLVFRSNPMYNKIEYNAPPTVGGDATSTSPTAESEGKRGLKLRKFIRNKQQQKKTEESTN